MLNDAARLECLARDAAVAAGATVLQVVRNSFSPTGVTVLALLAESHLSIHTWPEQGYAAVDCFTCGAHCRPEQACQLLAEQLGATRHTLHSVPRGAGATPDAASGATPGA
ncbi:hypothetical protein JCM14635_03650 [Megalodesulfovibrio paquesii]